MSNKCSAITRGGEACQGKPLEASAFCYAHEPAHADTRKRHAARGGRGRVSTVTTELQRLQQVFEDISDGVLEGTIDRGAAAVAIQALNGARGCAIGMIKSREQEELAQEVSEITQVLKDRGIAGYR
jgi:hypothetical protein